RHPRIATSCARPTSTRSPFTPEREWPERHGKKIQSRHSRVGPARARTLAPDAKGHLSRGFRACYSSGAAPFRAGGDDLKIMHSRHVRNRNLGIASLL